MNIVIVYHTKGLNCIVTTKRTYRLSEVNKLKTLKHIGKYRIKQLTIATEVTKEI